MDLKAIAVMFVLLGLLFWRYENVNEQRLVSQIAAASEKAKLDYMKQSIKDAQKFQSDLQKERDDHAKQLGDKVAEINRWRAMAEKASRTNPKAFGDDVHMRIAGIMCRIQAASDNSARARCDTAATQTSSPKVAVAITVTSDEAERWKELCDDGSKDHCNWSLTGFTPQNMLTLISWLEQVDGYALSQAKHIDGLHDFLNKKNTDSKE